MSDGKQVKYKSLCPRSVSSFNILWGDSDQWLQDVAHVEVEKAAHFLIYETIPKGLDV